MLLYLGFLFSIFLDYVRPASYLPIIGALRLNSLVPLTVLLATVFYKSVVSDQELFRHRNSRWLLFFMALLVISVLTADVTEFSFNMFTAVLGFVFWYYMIIKLVTTEPRMRGLFATLVLSHVVLLALNPQLILNPAVRSYIYGNTFLGDGNDYSMSVVIVIPMCLYLLMRSKSLWTRLLWMTALAGLMLAVIGTQSRGASIALACVFLFLWWKGRQKIIGVALIAAVVAAVISYAPDAYFDRINTLSNYEEEGSAMGRITAWKTAVRMAAAHPLQGVGSGHFAVKLGTEFRPPEFGNSMMPWLTAHSMYFLLLGELGIPGVTFLLAMLIGNFFINNRLMREARDKQSELAKLFMMLNASLVAFAIGGAFLSVAYYPHLYVLAGIWTAAGFILRHQLAEQQEGDDTATQESPEQRAERLVWGHAPSKELDVTR
ncbi:MAG: O-antigen ligase family protein [Thiohalobacteraceae bacterium]